MRGERSGGGRAGVRRWGQGDQSGGETKCNHRSKHVFDATVATRKDEIKIKHGGWAAHRKSNWLMPLTLFLNGVIGVH